MATSRGRAGETGSPDTRARKAFGWILIVVVVLAAGLSGAWYYLAGQLDMRAAQTIAAQKLRGTDIGCPGRTVFGYPFRLGLRCDALTIDAPREGFRASAGQLRTAAQIYRPNRVVAELDAPLIVDARQVAPLDIRWQLMQASGTFWTEGLDHFALVADEPVVALAQPAGDREPIATAVHVETHVRRRDADLDLAWMSRGGRIVAPGAPTLPSADTSAVVTVIGAANWLDGRIEGETPREALAGRTVTMRSLRVDMGDAGAELSGSLAFDPAGTATGDLELAVTDPEKVARLIGEAAPQIESVADTVAQAVNFIGRQENGRTVISLNLTRGALSAGIIPLGRIPPLR